MLKNQATGAVVYAPPQDAVVIERLMTQLVNFIHSDDDYEPLLRMAIAHHQFESIHPFFDGNGRTGRILYLLMLQREGLMELAVLYWCAIHSATFHNLELCISSGSGQCHSMTGEYLFCKYVRKPPFSEEPLLCH